MSVTTKDLTLLSQSAQKDNTNYNVLELGHAVTDNDIEAIRECVRNHPNIKEDEFYICCLLVKDNVKKDFKRRKWYVEFYLPMPRPEQTVFLYNQRTDIIQQLWCLPNAAMMAYLSESISVPDNRKRQKIWCDAFYAGSFWHTIREQQGRKDLISVEEQAARLTPEQILKIRNELRDLGHDDVNSARAKPTDGFQVELDKIVGPENIIPGKDRVDSLREA